MAFELYTEEGGRRLRCGFTTGSCAALASFGAAAYLLAGRMPETAAIVTPAGVPLEVPLSDEGSLPGKWAACGVVKDAGDDSDVTDGLKICALAAWESVKESGSGTKKDQAIEVNVGESVTEPDAEAETIPGKSAERTVLTELSRDELKRSGRESEAQAGKEKKPPEPEYIPLPGGRRLSFFLKGGEGVGRVTLPGLDQPVGEAAINRVPRQMIRKALEEAFAGMGEYEPPPGAALRITIYVPGGAEAAARTFNQKLGIRGGISILGTSGIVKPMSLQAFSDAVRLEVRQQAALGERRLVLVPGNYGLAFLEKFSEMEGGGRAPAEAEVCKEPERPASAQGAEREACIGSTSGSSGGGGASPARERFLGVPVVVCSNFIGDCLDEARANGFSEVLLVGHAGKLVKLAGGIMNTHSRFGDCRTELFAAHAAAAGAGTEVCRRLLGAATTDACLDILKEASVRGKKDLSSEVTGSLLRAMEGHLARRAGEALRAGAVMFSNVHGLLGMTEEAGAILARWKALAAPGAEG